VPTREALEKAFSLGLTKEQVAYNSQKLSEAKQSLGEKYMEALKEENCFATRVQAEVSMGVVLAENARKAKEKEEEEKEYSQKALAEMEIFIEKHGSDLLKERMIRGYDYAGLLLNEIGQYVFVERFGLSVTRTDGWYTGSGGDHEQEPTLKMIGKIDECTTILDEVFTEFPFLLAGGDVWLSRLDAGNNRDTYHRIGIELELAVRVGADDDIREINLFHEIDSNDEERS